MYWSIKPLTLGKEFVINFKNKYLNCYFSTFTFDKHLTFRFGKLDFKEYAFELNFFGLVELNFNMYFPFWGKYTKYQFTVGLLGISLFVAVEDRRNDQLLEERQKQLKEVRQCIGQKQLKTK